MAGTAIALLVVDQLTKRWAFSRLCLEPVGHACMATDLPIDLFWTLRLNLAFNTGMAFSRGSGSGPIIGVVVVAITVGLLVFARRLTSPVQLVIVGLVVGGALGNLIDRLLRAEAGFLSGAVVDFIDVQFWPIFNVADAAVVVGGITLALLGMRAPAEPDSPGAAPSDAASGGPATGGSASGSSASGDAAP